MQKILIICFGLFLIVAQAALAEPSPVSVTVQLNWLHQFEFAGYYAALHKGFYKDAGLDVTLKEGAPSISPIDEVTQGRADFGVSSSGLVKSYLEGKPVRVLAPIFQHSPEVLLSLGQNLHTPSDIALAGVIGLQPGDESLDLKAMFVNEGIGLAKLKISTESKGLEDLLSGKLVAMNAYLSNEPFLLKKRGISFRVIKPHQYGMDFYNGVLFTSTAVEKAQPEVVMAFRGATLKGWQYAMDHQDEIVGLILSQYNSQGKSREHLVFEAQTLVDVINPNLIELGHSNPWRWRHIAETYAKFGMLKSDYSLDGFFYDPNPPPPDMTWLYRLLVATTLALSVIAFIALHIHRLNRNLQQASQIIERTLDEQHKFMDMLTHELKTPIAVLSLTLGNLQGKEPQKRRAEQALDDMNNIVERCQQLDQLEHQKLTPHSQRCHANELLDDLRTSSLEPDRLSITQGTLPDFDCDPQLLRLIVRNLFNNAIKYSPAQSVIDVRAETVQDAGKSGIQISVQNSPGAAGMPDPEKIFGKYYRSPGAHRQTGSGLGLYLVRSFATLLGGHIRYENMNGKARFTLWIPC